MMARGLVGLLTLLVVFGSATSFAQEVPAARPSPPPGRPPVSAPADTPPPPVASEPVAPSERPPTAEAPPEATEAASEASPSAAPAVVEAPVVGRMAADQTADVSGDIAADDADAALAALAALATDDGEGVKLSVYGFADFTYSHAFGDQGFVGSPYSTFAVGNLNLYLGAELGQGFRSLAEIRFMYIPHGTQGLTSTSRVDTSVPDYADASRPVRWGGIEIERAWIERTFHELLTLRVGQWLTPYGIWNVDHGSPVIIGVNRPYVIGESLFPERQTGIEAYGAFYLNATQFGYHLTLSNGRGPIDAYQDLDRNKAVGGRLFVKNDSALGVVTVGLSGYKGKYTDRSKAYRTDEGGHLVVDDPITLEYDEVGFAADVKWEKAGFLFQSEAMLQDVAYVDGGRPPDPGLTGGPPGLVPDFRRLGFYALSGYRIPDWNLMPFLSGEYYRLGIHAIVPDAAALSMGLNYRPSPQVVLKAQLKHIYFPTLPVTGLATEAADRLDLQVAWSF